MSRIRTAMLALATLTLPVVGTAAPSDAADRGSDGTGQVFFPNPVASLQDQTLTDRKDADYAALQPAYELVTLTHLDGSGTLTGDCANIRGATGKKAYSADQRVHLRPQRRSLRTSDGVLLDHRGTAVLPGPRVRDRQTYRPVNEESQDLRINQWGVDNSYSWDKHDLIRLGKGGVDDAEDAEVILHEYGHAVHDAHGWTCRVSRPAASARASATTSR